MIKKDVYEYIGQAFATWMLIPAAAIADKKAIEKPEPGEIEVKTIPDGTIIAFRRGESYFEEKCRITRCCNNRNRESEPCKR